MSQNQTAATAQKAKGAEAKRIKMLANREQLIKQFEQQETYLRNFEITNGQQYQQLTLRKSRVEEVWTDYKQITNQLTGEFPTEEFSLDIEDRYLDLLATVNWLLLSNASYEPNHQPTPHTAHVNETIQPTPITRLPELSLPQFSGEDQDWMSFKTRFQTIVIDHPQASNLQKLHYLIQSIPEQCRAIINQFPCTADNFESAWDAISNRYENPRLLATAHVNALFNLPQINMSEPQTIRNFVDKFKINYSALLNLNLEVPPVELILLHSALSTCPINFVKDWERQCTIDRNPSLDDFFSFCEKMYKITSLSTTSTVKTEAKKGNKPFNSYFPNVAANTSNVKSNYNAYVKCSLCNDNHSLHLCSKFKSMNVDARYEHARNLHLHFNCLRKHVGPCQSRFRCHICQKEHHTLLHGAAKLSIQTNYYVNTQPRNLANSNSVVTSEKEISSNEQVVQTSNQQSAASNVGRHQRQTTQSGSEENPFTHSCHTLVELDKTDQLQSLITLLPTAKILVKGNNGKIYLAYALLDTASSCNLISQRLADALELPVNQLQAQLQTIAATTILKGEVTATIGSRVTQWFGHAKCFIVNQISQKLPSHPLQLCHWAPPKELNLANPDYMTPTNIDLLLGADLFARLMLQDKIVSHQNRPVLQNTQLGYIILGHYPTIDQQTYSASLTTNYMQLERMDQVTQQLKRFWELEEVHESLPTTPDEQLCEKEYIRTTHRDQSGQYVVSLPFKRTITKEELGSTRSCAYAQLLALEKRFLNNPQLERDYKEFMAEYLTLGHMYPIHKAQLEPNQPVYHIPHHCVLKEESTTTRLRVVFNGSCKSTTGLSLNELLLAGPTIQPDLFTISVNFRFYPVALTADIKKMYRCVRINSNHHNYQRILWRFSTDSPVTEYALATVTYGTTSAPFLAIRTLNQIAYDECKNSELLTKIITQDFYVDNLLTGADSEQEALELVQAIYQILEQAGFSLRKWQSNSTMVRSAIPETLRDNNDADCSLVDKEESQMLGLSWKADTDALYLSCNLQKFDSINHFTKRQLLSCVSSLFDPLGFVSPIIITAKILMQKVWKTGVSWDERIPTELNSEFIRTLQQLKETNTFAIPRCVTSKVSNAHFELHGFSDASLHAYGACIYATSLFNNTPRSMLLCAKSKVAPIKPLSVPKLELCAAVILSRLIFKVIQGLNRIPQQVKLYTDSTSVKSWIESPPNKSVMFVSLRVAEIVEKTANFTWYHVKSKDNPADIISRGTTTCDLKTSTLWWSGPSFLVNENSSQSHFAAHIIHRESNVSKEDIKEPTNCSEEFIKSISNIFSKHSSYQQIINIITYVFRFIYQLKKAKGKLCDTTFNPLEEKSEQLLIKIVQRLEFKNELIILKTGECMRSVRKLAPLPRED